MNLIHDVWIPVRRKNGEIVCIAPWQVTDRNGEEYVELAAPRPDFNGALIQFLIGLLQTACPPKNAGVWRKWLINPPNPEELKQAFKPLVEVFNLDGDGPRFMQDLTLKTNELKPIPLRFLLLGNPVENTEKLNIDLFVHKNNAGNQLCWKCAAMALLTYQTTGVSASGKFRTGLRGGGPLVSIIFGSNLWRTIWQNVLDENEFLSKGGNKRKSKLNDRFPWMAATRTSEKGEITSPEDIHPDQQYWATPNRFKLLFDNGGHKACDICGKEEQLFCNSFYREIKGCNYKGAWAHPLTPYQCKADDPTPYSFHLHERIGYQHWLGIVQASKDNRAVFQPARVVERFMGESANDFRLWVFGYDVKQAKIKAWRESLMPVMVVSETIKTKFEYYSATLVLATKELGGQLKKSIRFALFRKETEVRGDLSYVVDRLWERTEGAFYTHLDRLREILKTKDDSTSLRESWRVLLAKTAEEIFDEVSQNGVFESVEPGRVARAWKQLRWGMNGKNIRRILELSIDEKVKT